MKRDRYKTIVELPIYFHCNVSNKDMFVLLKARRKERHNHQGCKKSQRLDCLVAYLLLLLLLLLPPGEVILEC